MEDNGVIVCGMCLWGIGSQDKRNDDDGKGSRYAGCRLGELGHWTDFGGRDPGVGDKSDAAR